MVSPSHPIVLVQSSNRCSTDRQHRATWVSTELMLTFPTPVIKSITIIPQNTEETGGRFRVWLFLAGQPKLIWDRKVEGGFPELKALVRRLFLAYSSRSLTVTNRNSVYEITYNQESPWAIPIRNEDPRKPISIMHRACIHISICMCYVKL